MWAKQIKSLHLSWVFKTPLVYIHSSNEKPLLKSLSRVNTLSFLHKPKYMKVLKGQMAARVKELIQIYTETKNGLL